MTVSLLFKKMTFSLLSEVFVFVDMITEVRFIDNGEAIEADEV